MTQRLPEQLLAVVEQLARLPGLGSKSALRLAMTLLKWPESETRRLGESISTLRDSLCMCSRCGGLAAHDPCPICADGNREKNILCIVPEWDSLLTMEDGGFYNGQYLVLGGLLESGQKTGQLELDRLEKRLAEGETGEVVLALGATVEAENTAAYLKEILSRRFPGIKISRLAQGIPLGGQIKFMDRETLRQSLKYRQEF